MNIRETVCLFVFYHRFFIDSRIFPQSGISHIFSVTYCISSFSQGGNYIDERGGGGARSTPFCVLTSLKRMVRAARLNPTSSSYACYHTLNNFKLQISSKFTKISYLKKELLQQSSQGQYSLGRRFPCTCLLKRITFHSAGHLREPGDHHEVCEKWRILNLGTKKQP